MTEPDTGHFPAVMTRRLFWPALFIAYFILQALLRQWFGPALELDEAEAFFYARNLALGYNAQPPLYFWLQWGMFQIFGEGLAAIAILKAVLLSATLIVLYRMLLTAMPPLTAGIAATSLSLLPQVVWEAQRALTHSVLVLFMAVTLFAVTWVVVRRGWWRDYLALGLVVGLGILSKYNFAILPVGLLLSLMIDPVTRTGLRPLRIAASVVLAVLLVAPVAVWAINNADLASGSLQKLGLATMHPVTARIVGVGAFAVGLLSFLALAIVVLGGFFIRRDKGRVMAVPPVSRFMVTGAAVTLATLLVGVLIAGGTEVKDRWLLPVAWPFVPAIIIVLWPVLRQRQQRALTGIILGLWVLAAALLPYATFRNPGYRAADFHALVARIDDLSPGTTVILVGRTWLSGNLAFARPDLTIVKPNVAPDQAFVLLTGAGAAQGQIESLDLSGRAATPVPYDIAHGDLIDAIEITAVAAK